MLRFDGETAMKKLLLSMALFACLPAFAVCVPLDYQEMKDMTADELKTQLCKTRKQGSLHRLDGIDEFLRPKQSIGTNAKSAKRSASESLRQSSETLAEQCDGEESRILRVLKQKDQTASEKLEYFKAVCPASTFSGKK